MSHPKKIETVHAETLEGELCIYDWQRMEVHNLNSTAATVWQLCDGQTTPHEMAGHFNGDLTPAQAEELVWLTLKRLEKAHLLENEVVKPAGRKVYTRREMLVRLGVAAALLPVVSSIVAPGPVEAQSPQPPSTGSQTFNFSGATQTFTVPVGVTSVTIQAFGAQGGNQEDIPIGTPGLGGFGGSVQATITVAPGEILNVDVGGVGSIHTGTTGGAGGFGGGGSGGDASGTLGANGGSGGGGASTVSRGVTPLVVAGGGGGAGGRTWIFGDSIDGGAGGGTVAPGNGQTGSTGPDAIDGGGGGGGTSNGPGGTAGTAGIGTNNGTAGTAGAAGAGGNGGNGGTNDGAGGGGGGGGFHNGGGGGGGAGDPSGAAGGTYGNGGGGGGGASFTAPGGTGVTHQQGVRSGNGQVTISW